MTKMKKSAVALVAALAASLTGGLLALNRISADAMSVGRGYYGSQLTDEGAGAFYDTLVDMTTDFRSETNGTVTSAQVKEVLAAAYEAGDPSILRAFSTAVDSYSFDHSDLFYVDFHALDVRISKSGSSYTVNVGKGKTKTYLRSGVTTSDTLQLENEYADLLTGFTSGLEGSSVRDKVEIVNEKIKSSSVQYIHNATGSISEAAWTFADTAYGALKYGYADSEGYARLFNEAMNKLQVENCVLVSGYYVSEGTVKPWTWNYVKDGNEWFAVDVANNCIAEDDIFLMATGETFFVSHYEEKKVSAASYGLAYPKLATRDLPVESYIQKLKFKEDNVNGAVMVSYDGNDMESLPAGYVAKIRFLEDEIDMIWGDWLEFDSEDAALSYESDSDEEGNNYTSIYEGLDGSYGYEIAIFDADDVMLEYGNTNGVHSTLVYATTGSSDIRKALQDSTKTYEITIVFDSTLREELPEWYSEEDEDDDEDWEEEDPEDDPEDEPEDEPVYIYLESGDGEISNVVWNRDKKITFTFKPNSSVFSNGVYEFMTTLVCAGKTVMPFKVTFVAPAVNVGRTTADTRVYLEKSYGVSLDNNTNIDFTGWTDEDGKALKLTGNKQLILTTEDIHSEEQEGYIEMLTDPDEGLIDAARIKATTMYYLTLTANGKAVAMPDDTDLKVTFAYPEGYAYGAEGITYKVIHEGDEWAVLNSVATSYGIVASVNSFSSTFIVVALEAAEEDALVKSIITQVNGTGKVTASTNKSVNSLRENDEIEYTIEADEGYRIEYIVFNGESITVNELTSYYTTHIIAFSSDLPASSVLQVGFVEEFSYFAGSGVEEAAAKALIEKQFTVEEGEPPVAPPVIDTKSTTMQTIILATIIGVACLVGAIVLIYGVAVRPKIIREREEEEARIAANRERRANRNRANAGLPPRSGGSYSGSRPQGPTTPPRK